MLLAVYSLNRLTSSRLKICVIEAKQDKFDEGWTQALAEMVAAFKKGSAICYGIVTTGKAWEFGKLENSVFTREPDQVTTRDLQDLFDTLNWIVSLAEKEILKENYNQRGQNH